MSEPVISINGSEVTPAMAMTIRVALESFAIDLTGDEWASDESASAIASGYGSQICKIRYLIYTNPKS